MTQRLLFASVIFHQRTGLLIRWSRQPGLVLPILLREVKLPQHRKKTELKLTNVAKASQEELLSDYLAFLRQRELLTWDVNSVFAERVRCEKPETLVDLRRLMAVLVSELSESSDLSDKKLIKQEVAANTMICLIHQETFLLHRQITRLAEDFEMEGGFTERLYRKRRQSRNEVE